MVNQGRRDTIPELAIRRAVWRRGLRYRVDKAPLKGMRVAWTWFSAVHVLQVFVNGCFWHSCAQHGTLPKANRAWWIEKLNANVTRYRATDLHLRKADWRPVRVWGTREP